MQTALMPAVSVASSVPGRMRLKLPPGDFSGKESTVRETVHAISGVTDLRWTKITNSLVVHYDHRRTSSARILDQCQRALAPLTEPTTTISTVPLLAASTEGQPNGHSAAGTEVPHGHDEKPAVPPFSNSISPGKWLLGVSLVVVGAVLFIIPLVPGLPLLLMGLTLLELS